MAKRKSSKDYFGIGHTASVILAIIPITALILGVLTRLKEKHLVAAILRLLLGWNLIWILDILLVAFKGHILRIL